MKQQFIENLNKGQLDFNVAYYFYKEKGGTADPQLFNQLISMNPQQVIDKLLIHYEVQVIVGKDGQIIKYC